MTEDEIVEKITTIELKPALVLLSGGMDSSLVLKMVVDCQIPVRAIGFNYGQEAIKELDFAQKLCDKYNVPFEVLDISKLDLAGNLGKGKDKDSAVECLVPNRNAIFLSIATSYAIRHNISYVYYGATKHDEYSYFDTTLDFVYNFNILNEVSDINTVEVRAPLIDTYPEEILDMILQSDLDLNDMWSCYKNNKHPCGVCDTCKERSMAEIKKLGEIRDIEEKLIETIDNYRTILPEQQEELLKINKKTK